MYFKQIDLTGFKSFADRTMIRLEPGITAIVGPNGCGKSNILDALRWALGEQSARTLRGIHMQDVIFNGSENRPATGMAEVAVLFDNADSRLPVDFAEVEATRRLYRSGESEYLINKAACRLRDVQELFMDTGIGTNAYSLIGQGKIDLVLSSKPEDRRFLFEEAAGIIKYKSRKRVAMRKLEIAEHNLLRLNDIIAEVQRQMRSLKRQVNAAIRYRELREALCALEIRSFWIKYARLKDEVTRQREEFARAQDAYEQAAAETSRVEVRNEELAVSRLEVERALAARRDEVHQIAIEMERMDRQIALLRQQIDLSKEQRAQAAHEHDEFQQRAAEIHGQIERAEENARAGREEVETCQAALAAKQAEQDAAIERVREAEAAIESVRARSAEAMSSRARTQTEIETFAASIRNAEAQLEEVRGIQQSHDERSAEVTELLQQARRAEAEAQTALAALAEDRRRIAEDHAAKTRDVRALNDEWQGLRERKSSQDARLESLREMRHSFEGFAAGVRAVMAAKQRGLPEAHGIIGPAGDLLSTDKAYERAIEAALGGNINNVIVEQADAAKSAVGFLKQHQAGRVTFLPLDTIRPGQHDDTGAVRGQAGVIGPAIDYVRFDEPIRKAVEYLLHNTVVVESLDVAIRIARSEKRFPRLVTLDGEAISPAGAVTGGRMPHDAGGLLGRSAEIAELEKDVEGAEAEIGRTLSQIQTLAIAMNDLAERIKDLEAREAALRAQRNDFGVAVARHGAELEGIIQSAQHLHNQRDTLERQRQRLDQQRGDAMHRADTVRQDDQAIQQALAEAQDAVARARETLAARAAEVGDLRVRVAALTQRLEETERSRTRDQQDREEALRNAQRRLEHVEQLKQNEAALDREIALSISRATSLSKAHDDAHKRVVETQNRQQALLDETDAITRKLRDLHEKGRAAQSEVHRLEIALRHNEDQIGFVEERALAEYHLALASLDPETVGTDEWDEATREARVNELREKLDRLGQVNLMAVEEYEALEQRNQFLVTQEDDLRRAREALLGVVARIDRTILEMFLETFERVAENFRTYFRRLFNGGQARIYLLDESDPLECGIEIEARPPGKKPQGISLLSGGEQALTAIALLFSIFKAKPSPFCVLDEVDASLDDANIGRFLDMVDEFTSESQFIIITHCKQTMARANMLYGVTMQERGVSQLVSVKFDQPRQPQPV
jgi:chromosome segregation protein